MWNLLKRMVDNKKEYREMMDRVKQLPEDYQFVYDKIQHYMWNFAKGNGYDRLKVQYELIDLFEAGVLEGKPVLEFAGTNVAAFCDELLANCRTYTDDLRKTLNESILKKLGGK
ncbi:DUF1048 domain-containing protein [Listeria kieliensis]|uniref:Cytoplasmic protein n=1 Tax=Listeria kieliensis TaxID=1621700 RepID=A0A3D8TQB0_9LIST|nr:DUF1048 domain-containing protein [Listeria kieliensis]RDX01000.1 cytoplasmic protein [Listeria kieliensis]